MDNSPLSTNQGELKEHSILRRWVEAIPLGIFPIILGIVILARLPLTQSLWLDESMTWWAIQDSFSLLIQRSLHHQGQPLPYCSILWSLVHLFPVSEALLRLPSVLSLVGSALLLYLLVSKLADRETAIVTLLFYLPLDPVLVAGVSARPYGVALVASFASYYAALLWCERHQMKWGVTAAAMAALAFHCHLFFAGAALVVAAIVWWRGDALSWKQRWCVLGIYLSLAAPALIPLHYWPHMGAVFSHEDPPTIVTLLRGYLPPKTVIVFLCAIAGGLIVAPIRFRREVVSSPLFLLALGLFLIRPITFYTYAHLAGSAYYERWFLWGIPGICLVYALVIMAIRDPLPRRVTICVAALFFIGMEVARTWYPEDWREGVAALNEQLEHQQAPVLLYSALSETGISEWFSDPEQEAFLTAPLSYYRVNSGVYPVPLLPLSTEGGNILENLLSAQTYPATLFLIMLDHFRDPNERTKRLASSEYEEFFARHHYATEIVFRGISIKVFKLVRADPSLMQ